MEVLEGNLIHNEKVISLKTTIRNRDLALTAAFLGTVWPFDLNNSTFSQIVSRSISFYKRQTINFVQLFHFCKKN